MPLLTMLLGSLALLGWLLAGPGQADFFTDVGRFGPGKIVEGFENITPNGTNRGPVFEENWFLIGTNGPYDFSNGVTLVSPIPASNSDGRGPYIHDFGIKDNVSVDQLSSNGSIARSADVPSGMAYLGVWRDTVSFSLPFNFSRMSSAPGPISPVGPTSVIPCKHMMPMILCWLLI